MFERDLRDMSQGQLVVILTALRSHHEDAAWDVEDAELIIEIREELDRRGFSPFPDRSRRGPAESPLSKAAG